MRLSIFIVYKKNHFDFAETSTVKPKALCYINVIIFLLDDGHMQRSVSERNRHSSQKEKRERSPTNRNTDLTNNISSQQCNKLGYFQSTPNVATIKNNQLTLKREKSMYNATSESELLDREILPIFQKLLTERNKSQQNIDYMFGRSCPNISIKCDIVEYL